MLLAVVDTNVWVSAFLTPQGTSAKLLDAFSKGLLPVYSAEIEDEYRDVLYRQKLNISRNILAEFMLMLTDSGRLITPFVIDITDLPDPDDAPFIAAGVYATCPVITGNAKHFPLETGIEILSPAEALVRLQKS